MRPITRAERRMAWRPITLLISCHRQSDLALTQEGLYGRRRYAKIDASTIGGWTDDGMDGRRLAMHWIKVDGVTIGMRTVWWKSDAVQPPHACQMLHSAIIWYAEVHVQ